MEEGSREELQILEWQDDSTLLTVDVFNRVELRDHSGHVKEELALPGSLGSACLIGDKVAFIRATTELKLAGMGELAIAPRDGTSAVAVKTSNPLANLLCSH